MIIGEASAIVPNINYRYLYRKIFTCHGLNVDNYSTPIYRFWIIGRNLGIIITCVCSENDELTSLSNFLC